MVELIFLHLPKTGGSSMLQVLNHFYGKDKVRHFERDECIELNALDKKISEVIDPEVKVLHGHFRYLEIKDILKRDKPKLVTFMRDPVDRVISNYKWWHHCVNEEEDHSEKHRKDESLELYITRPETQNKVAFFLDGSRLRQYDFIGFLESYEQDLRGLGQLLGWGDIPQFHEKNSRQYAAGTKLEVSSALRKKIENLNRKDAKLYKRAHLKRHGKKGSLFRFI